MSADTDKAAVVPAVPSDAIALVDTLMLACEKFWWNDGPTGKTRDEMHAARSAVLAALSQTTQPQAEPVAEIVTFGGLDGQKEVSWRKGMMPPVGTKLYAAPPQAGAGKEQP